ncbi:MAG TPA: hypothetical protein VMP67_05875 [Candidatus Limnocylindria bacterium]|nr:hypothetical protein [Candidatus Limnocylindria bacterium]
MTDPNDDAAADAKLAGWVPRPLPRWRAHLTGAEWVLEALAAHFAGEPITVGRGADGTWWLASARFESLATASDVHDIGQQLISVLLAIARTRIGIGPDLELSGLFLEKLDDAHQQQHWIKAGEFTVYPRGHPELADTRDDRSREPDVELAERDWRVSRALAFLAAPRSWQSLYAAFELVLKDRRLGAKNAISERGWATEAEIDRLKETANNFGAVGVYARHGYLRYAPQHPLTLMEAESIVYRVVRHWLDALGGDAPP